jgi:hypothetical protein
VYLSTQHPEKGDIVISRLPRARVTYALSAVPGEDQIAYATYEHAVQWARTFAAVQNVDVWVRTTDGDLTRIARHRVTSLHGQARRMEKAHERSVDGLA